MIVRGHNEDFTRDPKPATEPVKNNGFNPCWDKTFTFHITVPEVALLELKVGRHKTMLALFGEAEIPSRIQQSLVLSSIINLQVKDHSKTGKDEHLGSFAARVSDMQEGKQPVSSFTFQTNFSGYRRVFLSDYSGREMRPASLFLKISKKWDAQ